MVTQGTTNILAPATGLDADTALNAYREHMAAIRGEAVEHAESFSNESNPFRSSSQDSQQDAQQAKIAEVQQYLSPMPMNEYSSDTDYTDDKHQRFVENFEDDPAYKQFGDELMEVLDTLDQGVKGGHISKADAMRMFADYGRNQLSPIIDKHHGPHSETNMLSLHEKRAPKVPDIVKKNKGVN